MLPVKIFLQRYSNVFAENQLLKFCFSVLLLLTVINSCSLRKVATSHRTVIIPAAAGYQFEVTGDGADEIYLRRMARYLVDLRANITPLNVKTKFNELLSLADAKHYPSLREKLQRLAAEFEQHRCMSQYVVIDEQQPIKVLNQTTLVVAATKYRVAGKEIVRKTPVSFHIGYHIEHGRFHLTELQETEKKEVSHAH